MNSFNEARRAVDDLWSKASEEHGELLNVAREYDLEEYPNSIEDATALLASHLLRGRTVARDI